MTPLLTKLLAGQLVPVDAAVSSDAIDNYLNKFSLNLCDISFIFLVTWISLQIANCCYYCTRLMQNHLVVSNSYYPLSYLYALL